MDGSVALGFQMKSAHIYTGNPTRDPVDMLYVLMQQHPELSTIHVDSFGPDDSILTEIIVALESLCEIKGSMESGAIIRQIATKHQKFIIASGDRWCIKWEYIG